MFMLMLTFRFPCMLLKISNVHQSTGSLGCTTELQRSRWQTGRGSKWAGIQAQKRLSSFWVTNGVNERKRTDSVRLQLRTFAKHWVACTVGRTGRRRSGQSGKLYLEFAWAKVRPTWRNLFTWAEDSFEAELWRIAPFPQVLFFSSLTSSFQHWKE